MTHLDYDVLNALQEVMEDEYPRLLDAFLADSQERMAQLRKALDVDELSKAAHSFKGSSSNMGAVWLADLCRQLEERASQRDVRSIEDLLSQINAEFVIVRDLYSHERQRFPC